MVPSIPYSSGEIGTVLSAEVLKRKVFDSTWPPLWSDLESHSAFTVILPHSVPFVLEVYGFLWCGDYQKTKHPVLVMEVSMPPTLTHRRRVRRLAFLSAGTAIATGFPPRSCISRLWYIGRGSSFPVRGGMSSRSKARGWSRIC